MNAPIQTNNASNGFFGTIALSKGEEAAKWEWDVAVQAVQCAFPSYAPVIARNFLDSVFGRHVADAVLSGSHIVTQIVGTNKGRKDFTRWMEETQRQTEAGWFED